MWQSIVLGERYRTGRRVDCELAFRRIGGYGECNLIAFGDRSGFYRGGGGDDAFACASVYDAGE